MRRNRIGAGLFVSVLLVLPFAIPPAHAEGANTKLTVAARIATFFRVQVEYQITSLMVTANDVERGYIDVPAASSFSIVTNALSGFVLDFRPRTDIFHAALITGLQQPFEIGAQGGSALHNVPHGRTTFHQLGFRFLLRPDLLPGAYPWPLEISVRAA